MNELVAKLGADEEKVCAAYAAAEKHGEVLRGSNINGKTPEQYARALWKDGINKGWLTR